MCGRPHDLLTEAAPVLAQRLLLGRALAASAAAAEAPLPLVLLAVVVGAVRRQVCPRLAQKPAVLAPVVLVLEVGVPLLSVKEDLQAHRALVLLPRQPLRGPVPLPAVEGHQVAPRHTEVALYCLERRKESQI